MSTKRENPRSLAELPGQKTHSEAIRTQNNHITPPQSGAIQQAIILRHLQQGNRLTTLQAREELGICHPAARVQSLREDGYNIVTHWATETDVTGRKHRIAENALMSGSGDSNGL